MKKVTAIVISIILVALSVACSGSPSPSAEPSLSAAPSPSSSASPDASPGASQSQPPVEETPAATGDTIETGEPGFKGDPDLQGWWNETYSGTWEWDGSMLQSYDAPGHNIILSPKFDIDTSKPFEISITANMDEDLRSGFILVYVDGGYVNGGKWINPQWDDPDEIIYEIYCFYLGRPDDDHEWEYVELTVTFDPYKYELSETGGNAPMTVDCILRYDGDVYKFLMKDTATGEQIWEETISHDQQPDFDLWGIFDDLSHVYIWHAGGPAGLMRIVDWSFKNI